MPDTAVSADLHKTADAAAGGDTAPGARKRPRLAAGPARIHALPRELEALLDAGGVTEAERKALLDGALLAPRYIRYAGASAGGLKGDGRRVRSRSRFIATCVVAWRAREVQGEA